MSHTHWTTSCGTVEETPWLRQMCTKGVLADFQKPWHIDHFVVEMRSCDEKEEERMEYRGMSVQRVSSMWGRGERGDAGKVMHQMHD